MVAADNSGLDSAIPPLLATLDTLLAVQRYLHPALVGQLKEKLSARVEALQDAGERLTAAAWPEDREEIARSVETSFDLTRKAIAGFLETPDQPEGIFMAYRALRYTPYAMEMLYPAAALLPSVSASFLEEAARADAGLRARLEAAESRPDTGVIHFNNARDQKGGCSLYVPEYYDPAISYPVVVALHGGSGHGRAFLWTWLREARSRGVIVISATACGDTWSLMQPEADSENIEDILEAACQRWNVDRTRMLMTGMSDGGTFTYLSGLRAASPFTHLAPIAASFHVMMLEMGGRMNIAGRPIYLTHGVQDWMFDVEVARIAHEVLRERGADIVFREIADLSHTYPRDENPRILDWFLEGRAPQPSAGSG